MIFDFSKLRGRIYEKFGNCANFAAAVGLSEPSLSARLNGRIALSSDEIVHWSQPEVLDIPAEEIPAYFLTPKVR